MIELEKKAEQLIPADVKYFTSTMLTEIFGLSRRHISNLIASGEIEGAVDFRTAKSKKSYIRIPRHCVVRFIIKRMRRQ